MRPNGSELKSVSTSLPVEGRPYIMDGWYTENIIMRSALPGSVGSIYLVRAANGQARPMFETLLTKAQFIASPDAGFLAYDEQDVNTQTHALKVMEPDGANAVTVANFTGGSIYPMIWSPDSSLIAFNYYSSFANGDPSAEVYVVSRTGGTRRWCIKAPRWGACSFRRMENICSWKRPLRFLAVIYSSSTSPRWSRRSCRLRAYQQITIGTRLRGGHRKDKKTALKIFLGQFSF